MLGPGPRLIKKSLPGRGLTKVEKHCSTLFNSSLIAILVSSVTENLKVRKWYDVEWINIPTESDESLLITGGDK